MLGEAQQIPELTAPVIASAETDGHALALIASGVCRANAYYRAPYDGGAAFLLIQDDSFPKPTDDPVKQIAEVFPQALASLAIGNHRRAWESYLGCFGLDSETRGEQVVSYRFGMLVLSTRFDELDRLIELEAQLST
jgi:hypothetical protein